MPVKKIRCFIALPLSGQVKKNLAQVQDQYKSTTLKASWVTLKNFHLTLLFLGDQSPDDLPIIQNTVSEAVNRVGAFDLFLSAPGVFPHISNPRILWMGLDGEIDKLQVVHRELISSLKHKPLKFKKQKFSPHITLGRIKGSGAGPVLKTEASKFCALNKIKFTVDKVDLYQSDLTPSGAIHTCIFSAPLQGTVPGDE